MWEHGGHSKRCGHLNHDDIGTSELQVRAKGLVTTLTNAIGRCAIISLFLGVLIACAKIIALKKACVLVTNQSKWIGFKCLCGK
jgi:hypothetical protein